MRDIQKEAEYRKIYLNRVGIKDIKYPIVIRQKNNKEQCVTANFTLSTDLDENIRGTHMSRFVELLNECKYIDEEKLKNMLLSLKTKLDAKCAYIDLSFIYFVEKISPVSKLKSLMDVEISIASELNEEDEYIFTSEFKVPIQSLCPCSKEISEFGAHNQRAFCIIRIKAPKLICFEEIVKIVEDCASTPLYPLLKRPDEKYVTEESYNKPKFVEDIVRDAVLKIMQMEDIYDYEVYTESQESIHNHNAFAYRRK